jgi:predicted acyltransferase
MYPDDKPLAEKSATGRLLSIDALRGFDMFWIVGGEELVKTFTVWAWDQWPWLHDAWAWVGETWSRHVGEWAVGTLPGVVDTQLQHVKWEGFHFYDLIFPLFVFVVGLVIPFSLGKMQRRGDPTWRIYARVFRRTILLFVLGMLYNGDFQRAYVEDWRIVGVLQRIAVAYLFASIIILHFRVRWQVVITAALLLGYWAILGFVPSPESGQAADYGRYSNLAGWIDQNWPHLKIFPDIYGYGDNEGLLSTIPAIATAMLGALAGQFLASGWSPWRKVALLFVGGLACLAVGLLWSLAFPLIKNLWTSSFVLVTGGWSLLLLAFFYTVIDVIGFRAWSFFFVVIGSNAIVIYILHDIVNWERVASFFFGTVEKHAGSFAPVVPHLGVMVLEWLFLLLLYRKRIFLRV